MTQVNLNLGTGTIVASGYVNGLRMVSSVGGVGNVITETGTGTVTFFFGEVVKEYTYPPKTDNH